jgi:SAM-dependent methyltransferase
MNDELERKVAGHCGRAAILDGILVALAAGGADVTRLNPEALGLIDEFHIGGRQATARLVAEMHLSRDQRVLDVGCGIGGTARFIAAQIGCRVNGFDLTPEYVDVARVLRLAPAARLQLAGETREYASQPEGRSDRAADDCGEGALIGVDEPAPCPFG